MFVSVLKLLYIAIWINPTNLPFSIVSEGDYLSVTVGNHYPTLSFISFSIDYYILVNKLLT